MSHSTGDHFDEDFKAETLGQIENPLSALTFLSMPQLPIVIVTPGKELCVAASLRTLGSTHLMGRH